jgi:hypothetical protein
MLMITNGLSEKRDNPITRRTTSVMSAYWGAPHAKASAPAMTYSILRAALRPLQRVIRRIQQGRLPYFPMQKLEKITPSTSSTVVAPVMASSACNAS